LIARQRKWFEHVLPKLAEVYEQIKT